MNNKFASRVTRVRRCKHQNRRGAAAVEFSITAGIALMFFFASFEFCRVAMIRHTVDNAVYEGARTGIIPGANQNEVKAKAKTILNSIGLQNASIKVTPSNLTDTVDKITVDISVPIDRNAFGASLFFKGKKVTRSLTMLRETAK